MENLRKIIEKKTLSKADKMLVIEMAQHHEFSYNDFNPACGDCYKDLAILLLQHLEQTEEQAPEPAEEERKILIKKGVDIIVNGVRVNRQTIKTDEQAKQLLELGLSKKYFEIIEDANK
jgi:hypothetical protein